MKTVFSALLVIFLSSASADWNQNEQSFVCPGDGFFPHSTDCSSYFRCDTGVATFRQCPEPLHYNKHLESCSWPLSGSCEPDEYDSIPQQASPPKDLVLIPQGVYCPLHCICVIAHPCNCSYFFRCNFGKPVLRMCDNGLLYNPLTEQCAEPFNVECVIEPHCSATTTTTTTTTTPPPPTTKRTTPPPRTTTRRTTPPPRPTTRRTTSPPPTTRPTTRPPRTTRSTKPPTTITEPTTTPQPQECCKDFTANRKNCSTYYVTDKDGKMTLVSCPRGLHFNRRTRVCDHPRFAGCIKPVGHCDCQCCMVQDPCDCQKYYYCEDEVLTHETCSDGLLFNEKTLTCDYHYNVHRKCEEDPFTTTSPITTPVTTTTKGPICGCGTCVLPNPSDCSSYYRCVHGSIQNVKCPTGQLFDRTEKKCRPKGHVRCPRVGDPELCQREEGLFPLPGKCTDFVECDRGVAYIQECPENTEFNPKTLRCDWPSKGCGRNVETADPRCPKASGLFRHPDNCGQFIHCEHGTGYVKDCASNLRFNVHLQVCDWPQNVDCGASMPMYSNSQDLVELDCKETPGIECPCACRIPNYDSCSGYYQCTDEGKACAKTCPSGLQFNRVTRVCDTPENVECSI